MSGWFAMKRGIHSHPIFYRRPDRISVWAWMLSTAAWKDTRQDAGGKTVTVLRGQLLTSYRQISDATGVGVQVIRTLIDQLRVEHAIDTVTNTGRLLITIRNYDKYQSGGVAGNTPPNKPLTSNQHTKEQDNKLTTSSNEEGAASPPSEPVEFNLLSKAVWDGGKPFLASRGVKNPGSLIGRWLKAHDPLAVLAALNAAQKSGTQDPIPYITKSLEGGCYAEHRHARSSSDRPAHRTDPALEQIARLAGLGQASGYGSP
jgi:hypothetical protein